MRITSSATLAAALCVAACDKAADQPSQGDVQQNVAGNAAPQTAAPAEERIPLSEPKGPIDPLGAEAAGQVVQHYGALIEQKRFREAEALWGTRGQARRFTAALRTYPEAHLEIGAPGNIEGAAGSVYVTMPVVFYGKLQTEASFRRPATVVLRRLNDVPGSTAEQRRWHIDRIDWAGD